LLKQTNQQETVYNNIAGLICVPRLHGDNKPFDWHKQSKPIRAWVYVGTIYQHKTNSYSFRILDLNALVASLKLVVIVGVNVLLIFGKENQTGDRSLFLFCLCVSELWCLVELENVGNDLAE